MRRFFLAALASLCLAALLPLAADAAPPQPGGPDAPAKQVYAYEGVRFTAPLPLVREDRGSGAVAFCFQEEKAGPPLLSVLLYPVPADLKEGMSRDELLQYVKSTYLATGKPGAPVQRTLLGKPCTGERQETTIPARAVLETWLVDLPDGRTLALGLSYDLSRVDEQDGEAFFQEVSSSLATSP